MNQQFEEQLPINTQKYSIPFLLTKAKQRFTNTLFAYYKVLFMGLNAKLLNLQGVY